MRAPIARLVAGARLAASVAAMLAASVAAMPLVLRSNAHARDDDLA